MIAIDARLPHPLFGHADAYQVLCDLADEKGWKVRIVWVDANGALLSQYETICSRRDRRLQLELDMGFGRLRERDRTIGGTAALHELASLLLDKVVVHDEH